MMVKVGMSWAWIRAEREVVRVRRKWWIFMLIFGLRIEDVFFLAGGLFNARGAGQGLG